MHRFAFGLLLACSAACGATVGGTSQTTAGKPSLAIENVTIVPMDSERTLPHQTVLIGGDRIVRIAAANQLTADAAGVRRIEGSGRFLIPGLADLHVHIWQPEDLLLYIANGVTTVRNMNGRPMHLEWREQIRRGELLGPDLYTSGPTIYSDPADADTLVSEQQKAGYDFIKLYHLVSLNGYRAVIAASKARGMRVVGHKPASQMTSADAVGMGMESLEHLLGYATQLERLPSPLRDALLRGEYSFRYTYAGVELDETKLRPAAEAMAASGGWICPTLVALDRWAPSEDLAPLMKRPHMRFVSPRFFQRTAEWNEAEYLAGSTPENRAQGRRVRREIVRELHRAGARLMLGTDGGSYHTEPGFSIHDELAALVEAGLTPYEALRTGTVRAAMYLRHPDWSGVIQEGARADLVLLRGNPLADIGHTRTPDGVITRGCWLDAESLRRRMEVGTVGPAC
jgi:Amidohydrolase family